MSGHKEVTSGDHNRGFTPGVGGVEGGVWRVDSMARLERLAHGANSRG